MLTTLCQYLNIYILHNPSALEKSGREDLAAPVSYALRHTADTGNKPRTAGSPATLSCPPAHADWQLEPCSCAAALPGDKWSPSLCWKTPCLRSYLPVTTSGSQDHMARIISGLLMLSKVHEEKGKDACQKRASLENPTAAGLAMSPRDPESTAPH